MKRANSAKLAQVLSKLEKDLERLNSALKKAQEMLRKREAEQVRARNSRDARLQIYTGFRDTLKRLDKQGAIQEHDRAAFVEDGDLPKTKVHGVSV